MQVAWSVSCGSRCRLSSGWEPKDTRGHELLTLCITKGTQDWWHHPCEWTLRDTAGAEVRRKSETCTIGRLWGYKSPDVFLLGVLKGTSSSCFCVTEWWNETAEILLWETWGWISKETWCDCMWVRCVGSQAEHHWLTGATHCEGTSVPAVSFWCWECDCQRVLWMVRLGSFFNNRPYWPPGHTAGSYSAGCQPATPSAFPLNSSQATPPQACITKCHD